MMKEKVKTVKERGGLWSSIKAALRWVCSLLLNRRFCIDELLNIARPVVYVYCVLKFGRRSYKPIKISILFDVLQLLFSAIRLWRSSKEKDQADGEADQNEKPKRKQFVLTQIEL